jgi:hypothetical protein
MEPIIRRPRQNDYFLIFFQHFRADLIKCDFTEWLQPISSGIFGEQHSESQEELVRQWPDRRSPICRERFFPIFLLNKEYIILHLFTAHISFSMPDASHYNIMLSLPHTFSHFTAYKFPCAYAFILQHLTMIISWNASGPPGWGRWPPLHITSIILFFEL